MRRPNGWVVGLIALMLIGAVVLRLDGGDGGVEMRGVSMVSPTMPLAMGGCVTVAAREAYERIDCVQSVRIDLMEGRLGIDEALFRLESCAAFREDLAEHAARQARLRADLFRARIAYGERLDEDERVAYDRLIEELGRPEPVAAGAVRRLEALGVTPWGIVSSREGEALRRLASDAAVRADFRAVFGDERADDLESLLSSEANAGGSALRIGETLVIPNRAPLLARSDGSVTVAMTGSTGALAVDADLYSTRIAAELRALEVARLRYMWSAAQRNQQTASIRAFVASARRLGQPDPVAAELAAETERQRGVLVARLANLERRLGVDPLLARMAGEGVGLVTHISEECADQATQRQKRIRVGAGVVTGLMGAAGAVVAAGAVGTTLGGLTIAAALEASVGSYLIARSEKLEQVVVSGAGRALGLPEDLEERRFERPDIGVDLLDGDDGAGGGDLEEWFEDMGAPADWALAEGDEVTEETGEFTEQRLRENTILAMLPIDMPNDLWELPPLLDTPVMHQLRDLDLPEIRDRLDEFLSNHDQSSWARFAEAEEVEVLTLEAMIVEAREALRLWQDERVLAERFGGFFIQAELERLPVARRTEGLNRAMGRYLHDRSIYRGTRDMDELRKRLAGRLVAHCRAGSSAGDLALAACTDETALSILLIAAWRDADVPVPLRHVVGVQAFGNRLEAVLYSRDLNEVYSLTKGTWTTGVVAPIYHPATFYYGYLLERGDNPTIDIDAHLLIALPNRASTRSERLECGQEPNRNLLGRAVEFLGSMVGIRRLPGEGCEGDEGGEGGSSEQSTGGVQANVSIPGIRNPFQRGGSGQAGGSSGGGGSGGGGRPAAAANAGTSSASGSGGSAGSDGNAREGSASGQSAEGGRGQGTDGNGGGSSVGEGANPDGFAEVEGMEGEGQDPAGRTADAEGGFGRAGSDGSGGYGIGSARGERGPDLLGVGRETIRMAEEFEESPSNRIAPWRLREDEGMMTGSLTRVLYADNARALERFDRDDAFLTLTPAEVEAQRRMLEADLFPIFPAETSCDDDFLPPRGVFRRIAAGEDDGFRYVYCDLMESMVIFREQREATAYASLSPVDRPLYLARLAAERLAVFERSLEMQALNAFILDPNTIRSRSRDEIYAMVKAAQDLIVFQNTLESALVQSMTEIGSYEAVRGIYYELHQQVLQAPLFIRMAESVHRLNQRLASDPLQSLAWANSQPTLARQGFFDLYHTLGRMMAWPERWEILRGRYAGEAAAMVPAADPDARSLDFLQILSDPVRVQIDWRAEGASIAFISDRLIQDGVARTTEERAEPTMSDKLDRQNEAEHLRGGTGGLGQAGEGAHLGPDAGRRPLQMIHIRVTPDDGDPDRLRVPDDNRIRPGGTIGTERKQTEESASLQEPILWIHPQTFIEAILSGWDARDLKPNSADRVPPILRFNQRLRQLFIRELYPIGVYDNRLRTAMSVFTDGEWLRYAEVREAMQGSWASVRARDTGRFSAAYSGNAPINDQDQIRVPNFFTRSGVILPADLFEPVRDHYSRSVLGIFDLSSDSRVVEAVPLRSIPVGAGDTAIQARARLLESLEMIRRQGTMQAN